MVEKHVERFQYVSGFVSCKLSIHMFSRVSEVKKNRYEMRRLYKNAQTRWYSYSSAQVQRGLLFHYIITDSR
jgi:hypothetical protein